MVETLTLFGGILWLLIIGHFFVDYCLQSDWIAKNKGTDFYAMLGHTSAHALFVYLVTGSYVLASAELICHTFIDTLKCDGRINIHKDQCLHIVCKVAWVFILYKMVT